MRRVITAGLSVAAIALPVGNGVAAARSSSAHAATIKKTVVKTVPGTVAQADRWGTVQVTLVVKKTTTITGKKKKVTRKVSDIRSSFVVHTGRSQYIMEQALPMLREETLAALAANANSIDLVSGATYTSNAFLESIQAALVRAKTV